MDANLFKFQTYDVIGGSINTGVSNLAIDFSNVTAALYVKINNDTSSKDLTIRLKIGTMSGFGNAITIKGGEELILSGIPIKAIDQSNASGTTIAFRYLLAGD